MKIKKVQKLSAEPRNKSRGRGSDLYRSANSRCESTKKKHTPIHTLMCVCACRPLFLVGVKQKRVTPAKKEKYRRFRGDMAHNYNNNIDDKEDKIRKK